MEDNGKSHIIMVDSGNYEDADKILTHIKTHYDKVIRARWSGYVIDAAIVTHPDDVQNIQTQKSLDARLMI